jgi:hypothetical protein
VRLGVTTFSFTNEWLAKRYTLDQLLGRVAELKLGPGIELIGFQAWRGFPELSTEEILRFRRIVDELQLEPAALGGYVDLARRVGRTMTTDEAVEFLAPQIRVANELGFPLVRLHLGNPAEVIERVTPLAERANVTLASEVQGSQAPDHPAVAPLLECHERLASPNLGLALDFSVAMSSVPRDFVEAVCRLGMRRETIDDLVARWAAGATTQELLGALDEAHAPAAAADEARAGFTRFGRQEPPVWSSLRDRIAYAHAKFWQLDEDGGDPSVRSAELLAMLAEGDYDGFVSSEWGGSAWREVDEVDAFELVRRHRAFCERSISASARPDRGPEHEGRGRRQTFAAM